MAVCWQRPLLFSPIQLREGPRRIPNGVTIRSRQVRLGLAVAFVGSVLALAIVGAETAFAAGGSTIAVNSLADNATPGDAACTLQEAINNANANTDTTSGDCVAGTYDDTVTFAVAGTIMLTSALPSITDIAGLRLVGLGSNSLVLDGGNAVQVLDVAGGASLVLDGLTVADGFAPDGGGIYNAGSLTVVNATFSNNVAGRPDYSGCRGGAIFNEGTLAISNSTLSDNVSGLAGYPGYGGAIYNSGDVVISDSTLSENMNAGTHGAGGAIFNTSRLVINRSVLSQNLGGNGGAINNSPLGGSDPDAVEATIVDSTLSNNYAHFYNGGAIANGGTLTLSNSTLSGNYTGEGDGGAIVNSGTLSVDRSTFSGNTVNQGSVGGAIWSTAGAVSVSNSTFSHNFARFGSGIFIGRWYPPGPGGGTLTVLNSTFSENGISPWPYPESISGGGIYSAGQLSVSHSTFADNVAAQGDGGGIATSGVADVSSSTFSGNWSRVRGGGIFNDGTLTLSYSTLSANRGAADGLGGGFFVGVNGVGTTTIISTILANTTASTGPDCAGGNLTDGGYNIASDASCGFTNSSSRMSTDPLLGPLADNGGPTQTMALLAGSLAINLIPAGTNGCGTTVTVDQRGVARPVGSGCDVGAYEDASAPVQLAYLLSVVGKSLTSTVAAAQRQVARDQTRLACLTLTAFRLEVRAAQVGRRISAAQAGSFIGEAKSIEALLGC